MKIILTEHIIIKKYFREPYLSIEGTIKNLMTSLRAVTDLQNPAIKDRHWVELMMATKVMFQEDTNISKYIFFISCTYHLNVVCFM